MASLEAMGLTFQDMSAIAEELGLEFGAGAGFSGDIDPQLQETMQTACRGGQGSPGGFPGGEISPEMQAAFTERGIVPGSNSGLNPVLLDAVIEFLESKVG